MRNAILRRIMELSSNEEKPLTELAEFWLVETDDSIETLEQATGLPIAHGWNSKARYGNAEFVPAWELLDEHPTCYEMTYITNDSGYGVVFWILKGVSNAALLKMCADYATQDTEMPV